MQAHVSQKKQQQQIPIRFKSALSSLVNATNASYTPKPNDGVDCCICLCDIGPFQALFVAPCSHCFHFKCIKPVLITPSIMFPCPVCRQVANLEASVSMESLTASRECIDMECDEYDEYDNGDTIRGGPGMLLEQYNVQLD